MRAKAEYVADRMEAKVQKKADRAADKVGGHV